MPRKLNQYPYVVGIDFGSTACSFSIAFEDDPTVYTIDNWSKNHRQLPASLLYKKNKTILCGVSPNDVEKDDIYIPNMNKYLLDLNLANKELEKYELTIAMVVTDYLREFHALAMKKLKETEKYKDIKQEGMKYCTICPSALQAFISKCFIKAGLIEENELRLYFTTKVNGSDIDAVHFAQQMSKPTRRNSIDILFRKKMDAAKSFDLILGIDFGTTFSGCSYSRLDNPKLIKTIKSGWPGDKSGIKVPTVLMYDDMGNKVKFWGQEAKSRARVRKENNLLENFKLYLSLSQAKLDKEFAGTLLDVYNNPDNEIVLEDVISDYLKLFYRHILNFVGEVDKTNLAVRLLKGEKKSKTKYVMTVPAIWNTVTRQIVMNAAFQANIVKKHDEIIVITELEAAALYCRNQTQELKNGNVTFIVCDAGGGTVDVGTFHLSSTRHMTQLGDCQSDTCGSFYLDANFRTFILQFYKDIGVHFDPALSKFDEFMENFVNRIKIDFMPDTTNDSYCDIDLPGSYVIAESVKTEQNKNYILADNNRTLRIKNEIMNNQVFNPVMERIEALLDKQMKRNKARFLFLVGGFAQSKYLQQRLRTRYEPNVLLIVPLESMSAVSLGAVHYALKPDILAS